MALSLTASCTSASRVNGSTTAPRTRAESSVSPFVVMTASAGRSTGPPSEGWPAEYMLQGGR
eukprot:14262908-Alexandrium_andersonii.AAC.1